MNEQQLFQVLTEVHQRLNDAGVPSAQGVECDDPACKSNLGHRVKVLIEERDRLVAERTRFAIAYAALKEANNVWKREEYTHPVNKHLIAIAAAKKEYEAALWEVIS